MANTYMRGQQDTRPWGTWEVIDCGNGFCVKHIPKLQHHKDRKEHTSLLRTYTYSPSVFSKQENIGKSLDVIVFENIKQRHEKSKEQHTY